MTLNAELDYLRGLANLLRDLSDEAVRAVHTGVSRDLYVPSDPSVAEPAVVAACAISNECVDDVLVYAVKERLGENGEIVDDVAHQLEQADSQGTGPALDLADLYATATGDWDVPEVPR